MAKLRNILAFTVIFQLIFFSMGSAQPLTDVRYVAPGADCAGLLPCYASIQAAVDDAASGDLIEIATGVYTGVTSPNGVPQIAYIAKTLSLRGGYNADFSAWDPQAYPTTLDAQGQGRVLYIDGTNISGSIAVTLDGLTLTGGTWSASEYVAYNDVPPGGLSNSWWQAGPGGGVRVQSANVTMLNSRLYNNHTFNGLGSGLLQHYGSFTMQNSTVQDNSGTGGIYSPLYGEKGGGLFFLQTTASISNSSILNNSAGYGSVNNGDEADGGGIFLNHSTATIDHSLIQGNMAAQNEYGRGGGIYSEIGSSVTLTNSSILDNMGGPNKQNNSSIGGGAYLATYNNGSNVLTGNLFRGNADNGIDIYGSMTITGNTFQNNTGGNYPSYLNIEGGIYLSGQGIFQNNSVINNSSPRGGGGNFSGSLVITGNTFQGNTAAGDGGGLVANGSVTLTHNLIQNNTSGGCGGGVMSNGLALEDGDLLLNNTAWLGGGLCIKANSSSASYQNLVVLNNQGSVNGSGIYVDRGSASGAVNLRHLTIGQNTGGDGAGVTVKTGGVAFINTILYSQAVGAQNIGGSPAFSHTLRYQVTTPTVGTVSDTFAVTGDPAFTADGYHLTQLSAAVDAGATTPVTDDVDGNPRPAGLAPDLGAVESPYTQNTPTGVQANVTAGTPQWITQWDPINNATFLLLQQDYLVQFSYGGAPTSPLINSYSIQSSLPSALQLFSQETSPAMNFSQADSQLTWNSTSALAAGNSGWVGVVGQSRDVPPGLNLNYSGKLSYSFNASQTYAIPLQAGTQVPVKPLQPPMLTNPFNGEMCLDENGKLEASGLTYAGVIVNLYENNALVGSVTSDTSGKFSLRWTSALTDTNPVNLYAKVCDPADPGACSAPSSSIHLELPDAYWCPQRSYWEGDAHNMHYVFHFVNDQGHFATNDFELPGVYGFAGTHLHLYSCCDMTTNPFTVIADGTTYTTPSSHVGRMWTFTIGSAHDVTIQSQCQVGGKPPSHGTILIDPDGFAFDSTKGGAYNAVTGMFTPVQAVAEITITAYVLEPDWGTWVVWPASLYNNQVNPQVTGADGYFAFFTPPGKYYLQATAANGYQAWRSPVIEVTSQAVHANIPLTAWTTSLAGKVALTPGGPDPAAIPIPVGGTVEWLSTLGASPSLSDLASLTNNPILRALSSLDPLTNSLGFDTGMLAPGQVYRRRFDQAGTYTYTDGAGHTAQVIVTNNQLYLPLLRK